MEGLSETVLWKKFICSECFPTYFSQLCVTLLHNAKYSLKMKRKKNPSTDFLMEKLNVSILCGAWHDTKNPSTTKQVKKKYGTTVNQRSKLQINYTITSVFQPGGTFFIQSKLIYINNHMVQYYTQKNFYFLFQIRIKFYNPNHSSRLQGRLCHWLENKNLNHKTFNQI